MKYLQPEKLYDKKTLIPQKLLFIQKHKLKILMILMSLVWIDIIFILT